MDKPYYDTRPISFQVPDLVPLCISHLAKVKKAGKVLAKSKEMWKSSVPGYKANTLLHIHVFHSKTGHIASLWYYIISWVWRVNCCEQNYKIMKRIYKAVWNETQKFSSYSSLVCIASKFIKHFSDVSKLKCLNSSNGDAHCQKSKLKGICCL